jgi:hypothetical protein
MSRRYSEETAFACASVREYTLNCGQTSDVGFYEFEAGGSTVRGVVCSFCGEHVEPGDIDPVEMTITARADRPHPEGFGVQMSWCHAACLDASGISDVHVIDPDYWEDVPPGR